MNILFFLTPKCEVAYIYEDETLRQALEKMEYHKYLRYPLSAEPDDTLEPSQREICSGESRISLI